MTQTASNIEEKIKAIVSDKFNLDRKEITMQSNFRNDFAADSLDRVELLMKFEQEFNIAIPEKEAEKIITVGQAIEYISRQNVEPSMESAI